MLRLYACFRWGYIQNAEAICKFSLRLYSKCWGYMQVFAEAICKMLRLYAGLCENIDHLSPVEAWAGTELGNKNINVFWWSCLKTLKIWFGFTLEPWSNLRGWKSTFPDFAEAICVLLRLYEYHSLRLYSKCWGYMYFFAEALWILLRLCAGLCENIDHLRQVEAGAGTKLGNLSEKVRIASAFGI